jgi:hypothetical protein
MIHALIDPTLVHGYGSDLWAVIFIDGDDNEDTRLEYWMANDMEDLEIQIREYLGLGEDSDNPESEEMFNSDWGFKILPNHTGLIKGPTT